MTAHPGTPPGPMANPLAGNPLLDRADVQRAVLALVEPLLPHFSPGNAQVHVASAGSVFAAPVIGLEGFARPLWGIVPLVVGGGEFPHWDRWAEGLAHGTDPAHPEYWGACGALIDQRMVEMAAIGFALTWTPEQLWDPLSGAQRDRVLTWLRGIESGDPAPNNWQFFRLLVQAGLERVGATVDLDARAASVAMIDSFAIGDGWYTDGVGGNIDWYVPFALHTYGLTLAASGLGDRDAAARWEDRARAIASDLVHWFASDGAGIPFGRSLTYRFAMGSFWGALALADVDALAWPEVRGLALRHLRWWSDRPISDRDGVVSIGYAYDSRTMGESYNSACSPYWCMKAFLMLAAPADHPFWAGPEALPAVPATVTLPRARMVIGRDEGQAVALMAPRSGWSIAEQSEAKYWKFAYSSRFGLTGDVPLHFATHTDSALAVTDPATGVRRVRGGVVASALIDDVALTRWSPFPGVRIDSAVWGGAPWHQRLHRIATDRDLVLSETGFALPWVPEGFGPATPESADVGWVSVVSPWGGATLVDRPRPGGPARTAAVRMPAPNVNLIAPNVVVPSLDVGVGPGVHHLACAVGASHDAGAVQYVLAPDVSDQVVRLLEEFVANEDPTPDEPPESLRRLTEDPRGRTTKLEAT